MAFPRKKINSLAFWRIHSKIDLYRNLSLVIKIIDIFVADDDTLYLWRHQSDLIEFQQERHKNCSNIDSRPCWFGLNKDYGLSLNVSQLILQAKSDPFIKWRGETQKGWMPKGRTPNFLNTNYAWMPRKEIKFENLNTQAFCNLHLRTHLCTSSHCLAVKTGVLASAFCAQSLAFGFLPSGIMSYSPTL